MIKDELYCLHVHCKSKGADHLCVTLQLICIFVFSYAYIRFARDQALSVVANLVLYVVRYQVGRTATRSDFLMSDMVVVFLTKLKWFLLFEK